MGIQSHKDDAMFKASLFILVILGTCGSQAKFVHQVGPDQFEVELEEMGTRLTQKVRFDADGQRITEVPAHNGRVAALYVFDDSMGLQMSVIESEKSCSLQVPLFNLNNKDEKGILEDSSRRDDEEAEVLKVEAARPRTLQLITVEGPELDRADVPSKMGKYCPDGFQFFAVKQIPVTSYNVENGKNATLIKDPRLQKDFNYGDPVDFSDLFQVLPMTNTNRRSSRAKRAVKECRRGDDSVIPSCHVVEGITCPFGCPAVHVVFQCDVGEPWYNWLTGSCEYLLMCSTVTPDKDCLYHITSAGQRCRPCCIARDCGRKMPQCEVPKR